MPHRIVHHVAELGVGFFAVLAAAISHMVIMDTAPGSPAHALALEWMMLPLVGAAFGCLVALLLNPNPEKRNVLAGRVIFGLFCGTVGPKIVSLIHPSLKELSVDPSVPLAAGFGACVVAFILSRPLIERMYASSGVDAEKLVDMAQRRAGLEAEKPDSKP